MLERSVSAVDQVIHAIKEGIRDARYAPGQRLVEPELMREVGVSRGSVREALRRLASEGFVEWQRYRGASIVRMSRRQVSDFLDLRELLEGFAARRAAEKIEPQGRARLLKLERTKNARSIVAGNYNSYNNEFHALIVDLGRNAELPSLLNQIRLPILRLQFNKLLLYPEQIRLSRGDHDKIVSAILEGAALAAERAMRQHVRHSAECILSSPKAFFA